MSKTQEELNQLKNEYESLTNKLKELTEEELIIVAGGDNDEPNLIINNGTGYLKAGFSGEDGPRCVFPKIKG